MGLKIRPLANNEYSSVETIVRSVGWTHTAERFRVQHHWQPDGFWLAEVNDIPAACIAVTSYVATGWIGYLVVRPEFQRQGVGRAMMDNAIAHLKDRGLSTIRLTASAQGAPQYVKLGFEPEYRYIAYQGIARGQAQASVRPYAEQDWDELAALDWLAFGDDRSRLVADLLHQNPQTALVAPGANGTPLGYCVFQGEQLGPMVASPRVAEALLDHALSLRQGQPVTVHVLEANKDALHLLEARGFKPAGDAMRMVLGPSEPGEGQPGIVFGAISRGNG